MRFLSVMLVLMMVGLGVPGVAAAPNCEDVTADATAAEGYYVDPDGPAVWQESNRVDGLQTQSCTKDGRTHQADTAVLAPTVPGLPGPGAINGLMDSAYRTCRQTSNLLPCRVFEGVRFY